MRILVGIDGSAESRHALAWAAQEAIAHDAELQVLHAYSPDDEQHSQASLTRLLEYDPTSTMLMERVQQGALHARIAAQERADQVIGRVVRDTLPPGDGLAVTVRTVPSGRPARTLVDASADADLLVVGSRGRGGVTGLLLGSVSAVCVQQAHCPVTVVPFTADRARRLSVVV